MQSDHWQRVASLVVCFSWVYLAEENATLPLLPASLLDGSVSSSQSLPVLEKPSRTHSTADILNCDGPAFSAEWATFRRGVTKSWAKNFPKNLQLARDAHNLVVKWTAELGMSVSSAQVLMGLEDVFQLRGFCVFGYATAHFILFRHDFDTMHLEAIVLSLGWAQWPVDFTESSEWPPLWRMVPLHMEHFKNRGNLSWSFRLRTWSDDTKYLRVPKLATFKAQLSSWLSKAGAFRYIPFQFQSDIMCQRKVLSTVQATAGGLRLAVVGHHMGSSMEPFTMLGEAMIQSGLEVQVFFYGQRHPKRDMLCKEFGYCDTNEAMDRWFQVYENRFLGEYDWMLEKWHHVTHELARILDEDDYMRRTDVFVCGGPFWLCLMLRTVKLLPMLLYFAWSAVPMVPTSLKPHLLAQLQSLGQTVTPPTVLLVANHILAAQLALQIRLHAPVIRPHGLYVNATYAPVAGSDGRLQVFVTRIAHWARDSGWAVLELTRQFANDAVDYPFQIIFLSIQKKGYPDTSSPLAYAEFAQYYACIFWPWDVMMLLFNELYTMEMPLFLPEPRWMYKLMAHSLAQTEMNWWHIRAPTVSATLAGSGATEFPLPFSPWCSKDASLREFAYWYQLTDFVQFPGVSNFCGLPDMLNKLISVDVNTRRKRMRQYNEETLKESRVFYMQAAVQLVAPHRGGECANHVGNSSGAEVIHEEAEEMFRAADHDGDGHINYEEFLEIVRSD